MATPYPTDFWKLPQQYGAWDQSLGFDPNLVAQLKFIQGAGGNPYLPSQTPIADIFGQTLQSTEPGDEFDITDQNKQFTGMKSMLSMMSDPAFHAWFAPQFGGGYGPEAFDPVVTYEPIDMPGRRLLNRMGSMGEGSLDRYIASEILGPSGTGADGATGQEIIDALIVAYNDPENPGHELALQIVPKTGSVDRTGGRGGNVNQAYTEPDFGALATKVNTVWNSYLSDPEGEFDEAGNMVVDPKTGLPARRLEEESEATKYFKSIGLPNPYAPYDTDAFISQDRKDYENQSLANYILKVQGMPGGPNGEPPILSGAQDISYLRQQLNDARRMLDQDRATMLREDQAVDSFARQQDALMRRISGKEAPYYEVVGTPEAPKPRPEYDAKKANQSYKDYLASGLQQQEAINARNIARDLGAPNPEMITPSQAATERRMLEELVAPKRTVTDKTLANRQASIRDYTKQFDRRAYDIMKADAAKQATEQSRLLRAQQMKQLQSAGYSPYQDRVRATMMAMQNLVMAPPKA